MDDIYQLPQTGDTIRGILEDIQKGVQGNFGKALLEAAAIKPKSIIETQLANASISARTLQANAVKTTAIDGGAVTKSKIADGAVTRQEMAQETIDSFAPAYTVSTSALTPGSSGLETGKLWITYE